MKMLKRIFTTLPILLLLSSIPLLLPSKTEASAFIFTSYTLDSNHTIEENLYIIGEHIQIDGIVDGDLVALGDTVEVNGTVTGDTYLLGGKIDVNANMYGNTFIFSNNANVGGLITGNTYIATTFLNYNADTQKDLTSFFLEATLKGSTGDDLRAFGSRSSIKSIVGGDLLFIVDKGMVYEENITGQIYDKEKVEQIAKAQGVDTERISNVNIPSINIERDWRTRVFTGVISFFSMLLVGFIIILLSPVKTYRIQEKITASTTEFLKSLTAGLLVSLILPLPLLLLTISIIGTPAAFLIIGLLSFLMVFGKIWVETALGREILVMLKVKEYRPFKSFLTGRVLTMLVNIIPIVGGFYNLILAFVTVGAVIRMKQEYYLLATKQAQEFREKKAKTLTKKTDTTKKKK